MNTTEIKVMNFYKNIDIFKPDQLSLNYISARLNVPVVFWEYSSEVAKWKGQVRMFLNENLNYQQRWQEFGHEIKHVFYDYGRQEFLSKSIVLFQEHKAEHFAYHFCVPTFMLDEMNSLTIYKVVDQFNVEYDFALRRLEMYKSKVISRREVAESSGAYLS